MARGGARPRRSEELGEGPPAGESLVERVPMLDARLAPAPAKADDPPVRHRVEVDEPQVEIAEDAAVLGDGGEVASEPLEEHGLRPLLLAEGTDVGALLARAAPGDGVEDFDLPAE